MATELLTTKLYVPPAHPSHIPRPRLFDQLVPTSINRLVLVSAPAGYGKTTLVSSWLKQSPHVGAWLSLDESDNDPIRFLQYLTKALEPVLPNLNIDWPGLVPEWPSEALMTTVINASARQPRSFVLVLDDFHLIHARPVLDMVTTLVERMPSQMRLMLLSRTDPPMPLARWRARGQMLDIRAAHLRMTRPEMTLFLNTAMQLKLTDDDLAALEGRTEGWIAGLQLAALSMRDCTDLHGFVLGFAGSHHYIMDYLLDEVLKREPEAERDFLLQTSILPRLCGPLCDAILQDTAGTPNAQSMLEALEQRNLFLVPLDDERRWYRYHHLFADVLSRHLARILPGQVRELHLRASEWHERNGFMSAAVQHAFRAQDQERAVRLIEQNGCLLLMAGEAVTLNEWLETVAPCVPTHPWLGILKGWVLTLTGQQEQVSQVLDDAERRLSGLAPALESTTEVRIMRGALAAARAHSASNKRDPAAAEFAGQALACLPEGDELSDSLRSVSTLILGDARRLSGHLQDAKQAYSEAARIGHTAGNPHLVILGNSGLADILVDEGQLTLAAGRLSEALLFATRAGRTRSPWVDRVLALLSRVAYARNELDAAAGYARQCIEFCVESGTLEFAVVVHMGLARLAEARGHPDQALEALRAAEQLARGQVMSPERAVGMQCTLASLWLRQGNYEQVARFLKANNIDDQAVPSVAQEPMHLILLRMYLAERDYERALALSERLLSSADADGRMGRVIEILILRALTYQGMGNLDQALSTLAKAVALAEPERAMRVFLDEGDAMARLLHQLRAHHLGTPFLADIIAALPEKLVNASLDAQPLVEPVSARELQVLKLIAAGDSNEEIARKLVISIKTAKRHISNINAKLGAKNRTQAVALARELKLME